MSKKLSKKSPVSDDIKTTQGLLVLFNAFTLVFVLTSLLTALLAACGAFDVRVALVPGILAGSFGAIALLQGARLEYLEQLGNEQKH